MMPQIYRHVFVPWAGTSCCGIMCPAEEEGWNGSLYGEIFLGNSAKDAFQLTNLNGYGVDKSQQPPAKRVA